MKCLISVNMDNEAFAADPDLELARILREAAIKLMNGVMGDSGLALMDSNGNKVGTLTIEM